VADSFIGGRACGTMSSQVFLLIGVFDICPPCLNFRLTGQQLSHDKHPLLSDSAVLNRRNGRVGISGSHVPPLPSNITEIESRRRRIGQLRPDPRQLHRCRRDSGQAFCSAPEQRRLQVGTRSAAVFRNSAAHLVHHLGMLQASADARRKPPRGRTKEIAGRQVQRKFD